MKSSLLAIAGTAAYTYAYAVPAPPVDCCFSLSASGHVIGGPVGQLSDGQNRFGSGHHPDGYYCLHGGRIVDAHNRGCILTPPTTQFQCDEGVPGDAGFSVVGDQLLYRGSSAFIACPVDGYGQFNIYTKGVSDQCQPIHLAAHGNCTKPLPPPPPPAPTTPCPESVKTTPSVSTPPPPPPPAPTTPCPESQKTTSSIPKPTTTPCPEPVKTTSSAPTPYYSLAPPLYTYPAVPEHHVGCPPNLDGAYAAPYNLTYLHGDLKTHSIKSIERAQYFPILARDAASLFQFGIPGNFAGKQCSLIFTWPTKDKLQTSSFTTSGSGDLVFSSFEDKKVLGTIKNAQPGHNSVIATYECPKVPSVAIVGQTTGDLYLSYFQDYNPEPSKYSPASIASLC